MNDSRDRDRTPSTSPSNLPSDAATSRTRSPESTWPGQRPAEGTLGETSLPIGVRQRRRRRRLSRWVFALTLFVIVAVPLAIAAIMGMVYWQARTDEARPVDAIVILGAAQYNGRPSPVLEARLDHALDLWNRGLATRIVVTGGKQAGDAYTEAETEATYLIERGVPEDAILYENTAHDTWDSMQGVAAVLKEAGLSRVLIVSDGFHLLRAELMARHLGLTPYSSPATESPIAAWSGTEFSYVIRETGGIIVFLPKMLF